MILTVTLNPTIDRATFVRDFRLGTVVRGEREVVTPSGKGVDSSLVIHELGGETIATGFNAGHTGRQLTDMLDEMGIAHDFVLTSGDTRMAVVLVDLAVGQQSTISVPTLKATRSHLARLLELLDRYAAQTWGVICAGSLPPGLPLDSYRQLLCRARRLGLFTLLDASGEALRQGVAGLPHVLKVNHRELDVLEPGLLGRGREGGRRHAVSRGDGSERDNGVLCAPGNVVDLAEKLRGRLDKWASDALIVTLGEQGALAVVSEGSYYARPPEVPVVNTAGAGDALNGAIMLARSRGADWHTALALGTAAAASVVMNEGTAICRREQVHELLRQVQVSCLTDGT